VGSSFEKQNAVVKGGSEESRTALLARRRRTILRRCLLGVLLSATGFSMVVDGEPKLLWCLITLLFSVCTVCWAGLLLLPPEDLLEFPESHFWWIPPSESEVEEGSYGLREADEPPATMPQPLETSYGVWDRDLDGLL